MAVKVSPAAALCTHTVGLVFWENVLKSALPGGSQPVLLSPAVAPGPSLPVHPNLHLILGCLLVTRSGRCGYTTRPAHHIWGSRTLLVGSFLVPSLFWRLWEMGSGETCLNQPGSDTTPESSRNHWRYQPQYDQPNAIYLLQP